MEIFTEDNNITIIIDEYQYDGTIQADGSIYNNDFEIYHNDINSYTEWCKQDHIEQGRN